MPDTPTQSFFDQRVGRIFRLQNGTALELVECVPLPDGLAREPGRTFSLMFRGPAGGVMPQAIYALTDETPDTLEIFLVPVKADSAGVYYQAIFN